MQVVVHVFAMRPESPVGQFSFCSIFGAILTYTPYLEYTGNETTTMNAPIKTAPAPSVRRSLAPAAIRAFIRLAAAWNLSIHQQAVLLGLEPGQHSTLFKWKSDPEHASPSRDTIERISYLLGIYKDLHILLPDDAAADAWIHQPNTAPLFGNRSALARLLSGNVSDLFIVRSYLDAERG